jgi:hypothetical protein
VATVFRGHRWAVATDGCAFTALRDVRALSRGRRVAVIAKAARALLTPQCHSAGREITSAAMARFLRGVSARAKEPSRGEIAFGLVLDRRLLKRFLGPLATQNMKLHFRGSLDPVRFSGPGWIVVVMPMHSPDKTGPRLTWRIPRHG